MLKKSFLAFLVVIIALSGCRKRPPQSTYVKRQRPEPVKQAAPQLPPADQLGEKTTFELTYHGISGKDDDLRNSGGWGFGGTNSDSPFIEEVRKAAQNKIYVAYNFYLYDRELSAIEYKGKQVLYAYFDINGDGAFSDDERLSPATDISEVNRRGDDTTVFITPDFTVIDDMGKKMPFRVMMWVNFYDNSTPNVTWSPMGVYTGTAYLNGKPTDLYLFPDFSSRSYAQYGRSNYSLVPASQVKSEWVDRSSFSSLIVYDNKFYRVTVDDVNPESQTITVSLIEDKSPHGKIALDVKGKGEFKHDLGSATLHGSTDRTIHFNIRENLTDLPAGEYAISYGTLRYGKEDISEYSSPFENIPAFAVNAGETTTIKMGTPEVKIQAVEEDRQYYSDKTYKTEFPKGTEIYIDAIFTGLAKETYRGFSQRVKVDDYYQIQDIKGRILITDSSGNEVVNEELEYG